MPAQRLLRAAGRLLGMLGDEESAVVGGLAVSAHGYVRATRDVDILVSLPLAEARRRLAAHGVKTQLLRGDVLEGGFACLTGALGGVPFDILPPLVPLEAERTVQLDVGRISLRVVDFDTLARLKLKAGSPKDLWDLAILVHPAPRRRGGVLELAAHVPEVLERLKALLEDPRAKREARDRLVEEKRIKRLRTQGSRGRRLT